MVFWIHLPLNPLISFSRMSVQLVKQALGVFSLKYSLCSFCKDLVASQPTGRAFLTIITLLLYRFLQNLESRPQGPSSLATAESRPLGSFYSSAGFLGPLVPPGITYGGLALSPSDSWPLRLSSVCDPQSSAAE